MQKTDFIIVGQGLAGSILALELLKHHKTVLVIDKPDMSQCSKVAAGIFNPVVFKRLTSSWLADKALPVMLDFFSEAEKLFNTKLIYQTKIARVFASEQEQALWKKKAVNELSDFITPEIQSPKNEFDFLKSNFGFVHTGGFIDVPTFLEQTNLYLQSKNALLQECFLYDDIVINENTIYYKNHETNKLIFCEGHLTTQNPFFKELKFKPAKGETLTIYCEELKTKTIINKDFFILPLPEENYFKVGATYNWIDFTNMPTDEAKNSLEEKVKSIIPFPYKVIRQQAGVRPSTIDRRPVVGFQPTHINMGIFNGFGTKAVMLAPYFAKHFYDFMENKTELFFDVDIKRFYT